VNSTLPPLDALDTESFRRILAGLQDPENSARYTPDKFREDASQLVFLLALCFNRDELNPTTLWERIASALRTACSKVDDGDLDRLISLALEHVKADHTKVAANEMATAIIGQLTEQDDSWRLGFVRYIKTHDYTAIVHGRRYWELHKETVKENRNVELTAA
jgi:hypothetical protein